MLSVKGHVTNVLPLSEKIFMLLQPVMQQNVALHIARQFSLILNTFLQEYLDHF